ncbi:MAG: M20/M25/M40 family metallo-hydrolase [Pyrinomonadaceae bacterium]
MKLQKITRFSIIVFLLNSFILPTVLFAQDNKQTEIYAAIRKEGMDNSKIMNTLHYFTDVYGPRLTGSPNYVNAAKWALREMQAWGFDNAALEPFEFGYPGWVNERNIGLMLKPVQDTLTYEVLAWTPSTKGVAIADAVSFVIPTFPVAQNPQIVQMPTPEELIAYFDSMKSAVNGKIVLVGKPTFIDQSKEPSPKRISDEVMKCRMDPAKKPEDCGTGGFPSGANQPQPTPRPNALTAAKVSEAVDAFLLANNVLVRINQSSLDRGAVRAFNNQTFDITQVVPTVVMRSEDFGRIYRLLANKTQVQLEFDLRSRIVPDGVTSYNVVGEIYGSDKKDEVVMLGGHLDSWHSATGATDNAIGCATMMEAARILKAIGVKPRRTIRVACWGGEEQGLIGSQAYVKQHFGTAEKPTAEFSKFNGYFNIDSGTGRLRGLSVFGPAEAATVLREALAPFSDLGFAGVRNTNSRQLFGTDSASFNQAGLPGISASQDPIEYFGLTWHTNVDTYERIIESDAKASAIIFAAAVYTLAMREEMLPRFKAGEMPQLTTPSPSPTVSPSPTARP